MIGAWQAGAIAEPVVSGSCSCSDLASSFHVAPKSVDTYRPLKTSGYGSAPPVGSSLTSSTGAPPLNLFASWTIAYTTLWSWSGPLAMPRETRPISDWLAVGIAVLANDPGAPVAEV